MDTTPVSMPINLDTTSNTRPRNNMSNSNAESTNGQPLPKNNTMPQAESHNTPANGRGHEMSNAGASTTDRRQQAGALACTGVIHINAGLDSLDINNSGGSSRSVGNSLFPAAPVVTNTNALTTSGQSLLRQSIASGLAQPGAPLGTQAASVSQATGYVQGDNVVPNTSSVPPMDADNAPITQQVSQQMLNLQQPMPTGNFPMPMPTQLVQQMGNMSLDSTSERRESNLGAIVSSLKEKVNEHNTNNPSSADQRGTKRGRDGQSHSSSDRGDARNENVSSPSKYRKLPTSKQVNQSP